MNVQPGDVLLMTRMENLFIKVLCKCICELDNGPVGLAPVCHAAIVDRAGTVASMEAKGLAVETLDGILENSGQCWLYRVKDTTIDLTPLLDRIDYYEKNAPAYAFMDYALLPFIVLSRKAAVDLLPLDKRIELRAIIDQCCWKIESLIRLNKDALICSELVFRCLTEAGIPIAIPNATEFAELKYEWTPNSFMTKDQINLMLDLRNKLGQLRRSMSEPLPNWVTPGDLLGSSSLTLIGQLK